MAYDLKLNKSGDLAIDDSGLITVFDGAERVAQQVRVTLKTFLGEWFLDTSFGVPYLDSIFVKTPNRAEIEAIFRARIADVPGVEKITSMTLQIDREIRMLRVAFEIETSLGPASGSVTV